MLQKLIATLGCLLLSCALYAQNGWVPPVFFPSNSNVCESNAWKLVFFDDFNGDSLSNKWTTTVRYDKASVIRNNVGVEKGEHDDQPDARRSGGPSIFKDENIVLANGICSMKQMYDPGSSWTVRDSATAGYPLVTLNADLSTAIIRLRQNLPDANMTAVGYSSGKFQARMRLPSAYYTWPSFWLWMGRGFVDEIDITENYGGDYTFYSNYISTPHPVHFNTVAWWQEIIHGSYNPYNLPEKVPMTNQYPYQNWYNVIFGTYLNKTTWHTYTCEWDSASLSYQFDNENFDKIWKYSNRRRLIANQVSGTTEYVINVGSGCLPSSGTWSITMGYPWNSDNANCDVRISSGYTAGGRDYYHNLYGDSSHLIGTLDVDFVKIWQRNPAKDNHTELCADNTYPTAPAISGTNEVCGEVSYTLSPSMTGTWSSWNDNILQVTSSSSSGCTVAKQAGSAFNGGYISFSYGNGIEGCPLKTVSKRALYCNRSTDWQIMLPTVLTNNNTGRFHFISELYYKRDIVGGTTPVVIWNISVNKGQDFYDAETAENYTLYGQYASSPSFPVTDNNLSYNLRWTMNVTDASGTWSRRGERNSKTTLMQQTADTNTYYLNAYIDDEDVYDTTVYYGIASGMVSEAELADSLYTSEMIEKVKVVALEPYLIGMDMETMSKGVNNIKELPKMDTKVYPNPVKSTITIIAGSSFIGGQNITANFYDLMGRLVGSSVMEYTKGNVMHCNTADLAPGNYILELKQGKLNEHVKITKVAE